MIFLNYYNIIWGMPNCQSCDHLGRLLKIQDIQDPLAFHIRREAEVPLWLNASVGLPAILSRRGEVDIHHGSVGRPWMFFRDQGGYGKENRL